jgi:uncharacterized protein
MAIPGVAPLPRTASGHVAGSRRASRHRVRALVLAVAVLAGAPGAFYGGLGWYFAGELNSSALDGAARCAAADAEPFSIQVLAMTGGTITLSVPPEPDVLLQEGTWGLEGQGGGFGQIGAVQSRSTGTITRDYRLFGSTPIEIGERARLIHQAFPADPLEALGVPFQDVTYDGQLGRYPAWLVAGSRDDWAVLVHGNGMLRSDMIRLLGPIHDLGLTAFVITYRNDTGAPPDPSGKLTYGLNEWRDLEAAVRYAEAHGARSVVIGGVSMGGGIVMSFLYRSPLAADVSAVILDSPMLDFVRTVEYQAGQQTLPIVGTGLPRSLVTVGRWIAGLRYGVDWDALHYLKDVGRLKVPILLFHGTADTGVPIATSAELAAARPDLVTYVVTPGAGHVDSWNLTPARYDAFVSDFLAARRAA